MSDKCNAPVGVFDSGVGGLTVAREIMRNLPEENIVYFGDTARVPYGTKSKDTVLRYSRQIIRFLKTQDVKAIVIACNTASAYALEDVEKELDIPIIGVVKPGAKVACEATHNKKIGVIATEATINSGIYSSYITRQDPQIQVIGKACPLFVPLVEEGWLKDSVTFEVAGRYLRKLMEQDIDTLILGCTHYPLLRSTLREIVGEKVTLVNPAYETARELKQLLAEKGLTAKYSFSDILGKSKAIRENIHMAQRYSRVNSNVLIVGETGTGKELFAHSIHQASSRSDQPFVALNCAALPENLLESELFGYEAGAFSGAAKGGKIGLFELAHRGTIFLDEIGEIPITLQAKLLRVLQEKEIRRIGSTSVHPIDVRVVSATNINIEEKIRSGQFRSDLYYRLNLLDISIPPLRERREDVQELVDFYLTRFACEMGKRIPTVTPEAAQLLMQYDWPGNVRELRNVCERLIVLNDSDFVSAELLRQLKIFRESKAREPVILPEEQMEDTVYSRLKPKKKKKELAEELGVSRTTLWRMAKRQSELEQKQREQEISKRRSE